MRNDSASIWGCVNLNDAFAFELQWHDEGEELIKEQLYFVDAKTGIVTKKSSEDFRTIFDEKLSGWNITDPQVLNMTRFNTSFTETSFISHAHIQVRSLCVIDRLGKLCMHVTSFVELDTSEENPEEDQWYQFEYQHQPSSLKTLAFQSLVKRFPTILEDEEKMRILGIPERIIQAATEHRGWKGENIVSHSLRELHA